MQRTRDKYNPDTNIVPVFREYIFPSDIDPHVDNINRTIKSGEMAHMSYACKSTFFQYRQAAANTDHKMARDDIMMEGIAAGVNGPTAGFTVEAVERRNIKRLSKLNDLEKAFNSVCGKK
jgi:hypothetical protein